MKNISNSTIQIWKKWKRDKQVLDANIEALKRTTVFSSFDSVTQQKYIKQLKREWKYEY